MVTTWLCTFEVKIDLPTTLTPWEMEATVAQALAVALPGFGYAGNCIVTLKATAGNVNVLQQDQQQAGSVSRQPNPQNVGVLSAPVAQQQAATQPQSPQQEIPTNPIGGV